MTDSNIVAHAKRVCNLPSVMEEISYLSRIRELQNQLKKITYQRNLLVYLLVCACIYDIARTFLCQ